MGDVSEHFSRSEFACSDNCGFEAVDTKLLEILEMVRKKFGPVIMHCACRCKEKNDEVGSKDSSQHLRGLAADFHIKNIANDKIAYFAGEELSETGGIGLYDWGIHIDVRQKMARWDNRGK